MNLNLDSKIFFLVLILLGASFLGTHSAQAILYGCEPDCSQGYSVIGDVYIDSANVTYEVRGPATPMQISACLYDQFWVAYACGVRFFSPGQFISGSLPLSGNSSPRIMFLFINVDGHSGTNNILFDYSVSTKPMPAQPINGVCSNPQVHYNCAPGGGTSVNNVAGASSWTWTCNGSGGGTNASCSEAVPVVPINGVCSNPQVHYNCAPGGGTSVNNVAGASFWTWTCNGSGGGTNASCSEAVPVVPINGVCSNPQVHYNCAPGGGTSVNNVAGASSWTWTCNGSNGGTNASCSEAVPVVPINGVCSNPQVHYNCAPGGGTSVNNVAGASSWTWTCNGSGGGTNASCSEAVPVVPINGVCSNPQVHYNCAPGGGTSVNNVAGASFWTWTCNGSGGGTNASCSEAVPPPLPTTGTVCVSSNTNDAYSVSGPESWSWNASGTTCFPNHSTGTYSASSSVGGSVSPSSATLTNGGTITFTITVGAPPPPPPPPPPTGYCYDPTATNYGLTLPCTYPDPTSVCQDKNATNYLRPLPCTYAPQAGVTLSWSLTGDTPWTRGNVTVVQGTRVYLELIGTNIPSNACVADWVGLVPYVYYSSVFPTQPSTLYTAYCQGDSGAYVYDYVTVKTVPPCAANTGASCTSSANACGQTNPGTIQCNGSCSATTPANPAGYGNACTSIANSCGQTNGGTIQCNGSCSATTPSNPPGYGVACTSSANACGQTQSNGTIQCNGSCSSTPPANPVGYGNVCTSSANSCGQTNTGTIQCNGTCSATTPANPAGYGSACTSSANACGQTNPGTILCNGSCSGITPSNSSCPVPTVTISANPNPVNYNTASTVTWSSTNTTSTCTVNGASYPTPGSDTTGPLANNTTYTIICQGLNGSQVTNSVTVSVNGPTVTISTNPTSVAYGGSSTISWSSSNASSCTKSGDWSGSTPPNVAGTQSTGALTPSPLGRTYTYTLTCSGANGSSNTQSATVTVSAPPAPTVTISANPNPVDYNTASTVTWSSTNTTSCTINGVGYPTSGSDTTGPLTNNATYTLTCQALDGSTKSASVTVSVNGPTVIISTNPTSVAYGGSSTISWSSSNASSCTKSGDWSGSTPPNVAGTQSTGVLVSGPLSQSKTYTYTLTCNGANGSSNSQSATVTVSPPPGPTLTISAAPNPVNYNTASTVTWSSTNTTSCTINGVGYPTSGSDTTGPLTNNATYNFLCTGPTGLTVSKSITVTVNSVSVTISTSPTSVNYNGSSTISWTVSSAGSCDASGDWGGHPDSSTGTHSQSTGALTSNKTYTIKCFGANGTSSGPVSASVSVNAPTVSISTSPTSVVYGGSSTISWSSSSVGSCTKSGDWSGSTPPNVAGNQSTGALNQVKTYTYTLMCSGNGSATQSATVNVSAPPPTTSNVSITEPDYCASGPAVTMSWAYSDPAGSPQSAYQVQLDDSGSFNSINVDSGKTMSSSNAWFSGQGVLSFNTVYHVRVRTWSGYDVVSPWQDASSCSGPGCTGGGSNSWKTPQYAYPQVDFTWTANSILNNPSPPMNKPVQFNDATVFNGNPNGRQWGWVFGDGGSSSTQNPAHTYTAEGTYYITLTATDNANQTCVRTKGPIIIQKPIPKWREIAPR